MKTHFYFFAFLSFFLKNGFAQDQIFLNPNQSLVSLNPSFAGSNGGIRNQFSYLNMWPKLDGQYVFFSNTMDGYVKKIKAGIALTASGSRQFELLKSNEISLAYAQHLFLMKGKLKVIPSVQIAYSDNRVSGLTSGGFFGPFSGGYYIPSVPPSTQKNVMDISTGLLINYGNFYAGASVFHLNRPDVGLYGVYRLASRTNVHISYNWRASSQLLLNFKLQYSNQNSFSHMSFNTNALIYKHLIVGASYGISDFVFTTIGYRSSFFSISLGTARTISKLSSNTANSYELNLSYTLRNKEERKTLADFERW